MAAKQRADGFEVATKNRTPYTAGTDRPIVWTGDLAAHRDLDTKTASEIIEIGNSPSPPPAKAEAASANDGADIQPFVQDAFHEAIGGHACESNVKARTKQQIESLAGEGQGGTLGCPDTLESA